MIKIKLSSVGNVNGNVKAAKVSYAEEQNSLADVNKNQLNNEQEIPISFNLLL